jgi:hypothetical protein
MLGSTSDRSTQPAGAYLSMLSVGDGVCDAGDEAALAGFAVGSGPGPGSGDEHAPSRPAITTNTTNLRAARGIRLSTTVIPSRAGQSHVTLDRVLGDR